MPMKQKLVLILIAIVLALPVKAQQYMTNQEPQDHDNAVGGAVAGAVVGGVVGNQLHHNTAAGIIVGGLTGALIGNAIDHKNDQQPQVVVVQQAPAPVPPPPQIIQKIPEPTRVTVSINYVWGPMDRRGIPMWVYVQTWNGYEWVSTYYPFNNFLTWYRGYWGHPFHEGEYHSHWHHR